MAVRFFKPRGTIVFNNGPAITSERAAPAPIQSSRNEVVGSFAGSTSAAFVPPVSSDSANAVVAPVFTSGAKTEMLVLGAGSWSKRDLPVFDTNLQDKITQPCIPEDPRILERFAVRSEAKRITPALISIAIDRTQPVTLSQSEVPRQFGAGSYSRLFTPPFMQIPLPPMAMVFAQENKERPRGDSRLISGFPDAPSVISPGFRILVSNDGKYDKLSQGAFFYLCAAPDYGLQDPAPLVTRSEPPNQLDGMILFANRGIVPTMSALPMADPLPKLIFSSSQTPRFAFTASTVTKHGVKLTVDVTAGKRLHVINHPSIPDALLSNRYGTASYQYGVEIFRRPPRILMTTPPVDRPNRDRYLASKAAFAMPVSQSLVTPGRFVGSGRIRDVYWDPSAPTRTLIWKIYPKTQDPPLVIDSFDVAYEIIDTFNIGDAGTPHANQIFFVGDVRRFQALDFTLDGSSWAATGATLYLVDPNLSSHSHAGTSGGAGLFYYDTTSSDLNLSGEWSVYWKLTDGTITITSFAGSFFVFDVK